MMRSYSSCFANHHPIRRNMALVLLSAASLLAGCELDLGPEDDGDGFGSGLRSQPASVSVTTLHLDTFIPSGLEYPRVTKVFQDQSSYETALVDYTSDSAVTVDFDRSQVLLLDMGTRSSSGYSVSVSNVEDDDQVTVFVQYVAPGNNCTVTTALTHPWAFVQVDTTKDLMLNETFSSLDC